MKHIIHSFVAIAIAVFMNAMSAKAQNGKFTADDLKLMVATVNSQLGAEMLKEEHLAPLKQGGDAAQTFAQANGLKKTSISGRYTFVPRGSNISKAWDPKDTTVTVVLADVNKLMGRAYAGTNMVFLYAFDQVPQTFLFITKYQDPSAVLAQAQQTPTVPTPQPSAQSVPVQQLTPAQQAFMDQVAYAMKGGAILDKSVAQDGHGHMTVIDSLGQLTTFDLTAAKVLYSTNPIFAPARGVSGPAVNQPYSATVQAPAATTNGSGVSRTATVSKTVTQQGDPELIAQLERGSQGGEVDHNTTANADLPPGCHRLPNGLIVCKEEVNGIETRTAYTPNGDIIPMDDNFNMANIDMGKGQKILTSYNKAEAGNMVNAHKHGMRDAAGYDKDNNYGKHGGRQTAAKFGWHNGSWVGCPGQGFVLSGGYWVNNGYNNNNCYPNGGGGNGSQMVVGNTYTGFQASVGGW